jgi:hypothetical protein
MSTVPTKLVDKITFFETHLPVWAVNPTAIGLTALQVADLTSMTAAARGAYESALASRSISLAATGTQNDLVGVMGTFGSDLIKTIRAFAETTNDSSVYQSAQIPPPAPPTPAGPPPKPTNLEAALLLPFGIGLSWKGSVASGAYFSIWRKLDTETAFSLVETTNDKSFEDRSLPVGIASVEYYIAANRDAFTINSVALTVSMGADGTANISMAA